MKDIVEFIIKQLVDDKNSVQIEESQDGSLNILTVKVSENDLGKVIGKGGKIATSIRTIVKSLSIKEKKRYIVKIGDK
ncbi:MAG: KH domain-containing protein [Christensenellales bacterium]|jgi:predicted RNA-binding protein YlqC (UPF0109 family)